MGFAQEIDQFVVDDLDQLLTGRYGREDVLTQRFLLDTLRKFSRHLVVDVGIQQCPPNLAHTLRDIQLGNPSLTTQ